MRLIDADALKNRIANCKSRKELDDMRLEIIEYMESTKDISIQQDFKKALNRCRRNGWS